MAEQNLNRTLMIHQSWTVLFTRPISAVLMIISVFTVLWSMTEALRIKMKEKSAMRQNREFTTKLDRLWGCLSGGCTPST